MTREPHLGSPVRFELDRAGAQFEVSGKTGVSGFPNRMVRFWQIQPSLMACNDDGDRANLHPNGVCATEGKC
jgi:hypothetical protein